MSRPGIMVIICCCLFASTTTVGWGQEYLDLPEDLPESRPTSLADKLLSLKDRFRRDSSQEGPTKSQKKRTSTTSKSKQRFSRYRNTPQSAPRSARNPAGDPSQSDSPSARRPATTSQGRTSPKLANSNPSGMANRPKPSDLLPDTNLFSRSNIPPAPAAPIEAKRLIRATDLPRAGSAKSQSVPPRVARRSPITSRANELDAALADLLKPQAPKPFRRPDARPTKSSARTPQRNLPTVSNTFDLRKALLDDESDSIASEVANAMEGTLETDAAALSEKAAESKAFAATVAKHTPAVAKQETTVAKQKATVPKQEPAAEKQELAKVKQQSAVAKQTPLKKTPAVVKGPSFQTAPTPVVASLPKTAARSNRAALPKAAEADVAAPIAMEPVLAQAPPKQAVTTNQPRQSPRVSAASSSIDSDDLFSASDALPAVNSRGDAVARKRFDAPQSTKNPMRNYLSATDADQPTAQPTRPDRGMLQTTQQPVIVSHVEGPRSILVGREATYQVTLENTSGTLASDLSAEISVPEWAELVDAMSTSGVVTRRNQVASAGVLEWKLSELTPRSSQALRLRLIPRSGRPLQLGVRWSQAPAQSKAIVEVQEPKLELAISGPQEVRFGKPQRYRLTLRNPGSGLTEQVSLRLVPPGGDSQSATTQKIGDLKPGEVKDIDLELTAREAGKLLIQADASADGGLTAEATKSVLCRKPELSVDWRGPDKKYAGTVAAYYFRIQNPGTAMTEPVEMSVKLPVGAEFVSASDGHSIDAKNGVVSWRLSGIDVQEEQFMQLSCKIDRPGKNDFAVRAQTGDGELSDSKDFHTEVVALADLKLEVSDPQGPLPAGESVVYEIRVRNRGTTVAENINIIGLFSEGIDPTTVEGAQFTVRDGRVSFHPIKNLSAGREVVLRIHAKPNKVGTHIFRAEVVCPKLDIKLAAEETTRFFEEEHRWEDGETPYTAERQTTINR